MNVKSKKPKFWRKLSFGDVVNKIMMTVIGTTISIVLTFGTSRYLEHVQAEEARRLVAMTIISDIDESLKVVKKLKETEEKGHDLTCYLMDHIDSLEKISDDSLLAFFDYIGSALFDVDQEFKKANENIFNSNLDSWNTLNDRKFLNNVQDIYNARALLERQIREWVYFKKPITKEEEYHMIMESGDMDSRKTILPLCRELLKSNRVKNYVKFFRARIICYANIMAYMNLNEENKMLMDITEQDLEDFANKAYLKVRPAKDHELVGEWNAVTTDDRHLLSFDFHKDHTFTYLRTIPWMDNIYTGFLIQKYIMTGTWHTKKDSLVLNFDMKRYRIEVDDKDISYMPRVADQIERIKKEKLEEKDKLPFVEALKNNSRKVYATNVDKQGTRMELTERDKKPMHYRKQIKD